MMNMLPNRKDRRISFSAAKKKLLKGFTLVELFITIMIMGIIAGGLVAMTGSFEHRRRLDSSALKLQEDLRLAQTYSMGAYNWQPMAPENYYKNYGVRFVTGVGPNGNRDGWQVVCYCPCASYDATTYRCTSQCNGSYNPTPTVPLPSTATYEVIVSSVTYATGINPYLNDNTFFAERVTIDASSAFQIGIANRDRIVFTQRGSATCNGSDLLDTANCSGTDIVLTAFGRTVPLRITPLTGHVQQMQ